MERLFEGFEILCTDYDHMFEKRVGIIQENMVCTSYIPNFESTFGFFKF